MEYGPAPEDAARARQWISERDATFGHWINGAWTGASHHFESVNPANQETLAMIGQAGSSDVDAAVSVARQALGPWQALGGEGRARHLYALARQVQKHARILSVIETLDNGKPIRETRDIDIPLVARHFYHHAGWATIVDEELPNSEPLGVIGQIIPWNFPLLMLAWKVAPALAAGNTVVLKPAEYTSLSALYFAQMSHDAGLPPGVLNIVTGDGNAGRELVEHSGINKVAFTGSTSVGREIREATAGSSKALTLELGGKSPFIVFADADLDSAVEGVVDAIWFNQGQVCCAGSRLLVQESVADDFLGRLKKRMRSLRLGDPLDKAIDMGAIVDQGQLETIRSYDESQLGKRIRITWSGAEYRGRGRNTLWRGLIDVEGASIVKADALNRWNPERLFEQRGSAQLAFESVTTGNFAGVDLWLNNHAASLSVKTNHGDLEIRLADLGLEAVTLDCGGLERQITVTRLPDRPLAQSLAFDRQVTLQGGVDNPVWVCVSTEDGHRAWSSPIYFVS